MLRCITRPVRQPFGKGMGKDDRFANSEAWLIRKLSCMAFEIKIIPQLKEGSMEESDAKEACEKLLA